MQIATAGWEVRLASIADGVSGKDSAETTDGSR
jgi:hypothetical protein